MCKIKNKKKKFRRSTNVVNIPPREYFRKVET